LYSIHPRTSAHLSAFLLTPPATTQPSTLSLHDALPISPAPSAPTKRTCPAGRGSSATRPASLESRGTNAVSIPDCSSARAVASRSEEHTSELQSPCNLVCRLLLEKKKKQNHTTACPHRT